MTARPSPRPASFPVAPVLRTIRPMVDLSDDGDEVVIDGSKTKMDQAKSAVLNKLSSADAQRGYRHAIDEFIEWYCSEPRLSFNRSVVLRYRIHLGSRNLAPGTVNLRLGVVRRPAYEAADCGLLSPDLAAGTRRVKGVKKLGVRLGNWFTVEQATTLWR
mgnify:CR=1 FL=1